MLKVDLNRGHMSAFDFSGTVVELSADLVLVFQLMYNEMRDRNGEKGKAIAEAFAGCVKDNIERAEKTAEDIDKYKAMFNGKIENLIKEIKEAMFKGMSDEKDKSDTNFSEDFHKFLYGEEDDE